MAVYCYECGSVNPEGSDFCTRCGAAIAPSPLVDGLVLPDWLTRAAAESYEPQPAPVPTSAMAVEAIAQPASPTPTSIPTGNLAATIPAWMKGPAAAPVIQPEPARRSDPTDTRSFISEDDLPAWIRQIGIADAARKAEIERASALPAQLEEEPVAPPPTLVRRRLLPGDVEAARVTANPWLSRAEPLQAEEPIARILPAATEPVKVGQFTGEAPPSATIRTPEAMRPSDNATSSPRPRLDPRYALVAAILALLIVLILVFVR